MFYRTAFLYHFYVIFSSFYLLLLLFFFRKRGRPAYSSEKSATKKSRQQSPEKNTKSEKKTTKELTSSNKRKESQQKKAASPSKSPPRRSPFVSADKLTSKASPRWVVVFLCFTLKPFFSSYFLAFVLAYHFRERGIVFNSQLWKTIVVNMAIYWGVLCHKL